ncbi:hypothetical protein L6452_43390 [Arctium lappa]|uniref:Uncharacterized protein n=1 Tax=Arctium lappa TaxID=4217 RepID=A0ACB8XLP6_ARCLA|nr:hypothetical protein L6452_43390 [Arctium lappa]
MWFWWWKSNDWHYGLIMNWLQQISESIPIICFVFSLLPLGTKLVLQLLFLSNFFGLWGTKLVLYSLLLICLFGLLSFYLEYVTKENNQIATTTDQSLNRCWMICGLEFEECVFQHLFSVSSFGRVLWLPMAWGQIGFFEGWYRWNLLEGIRWIKVIAVKKDKKENEKVFWEFGIVLQELVFINMSVSKKMGNGGIRGKALIGCRYQIRGKMWMVLNYSPWKSDLLVKMVNRSKFDFEDGLDWFDWDEDKNKVYWIKNNDGLGFHIIQKGVWIGAKKIDWDIKIFWADMVNMVRLIFYLDWARLTKRKSMKIMIWNGLGFVIPLLRIGILNWASLLFLKLVLIGLFTIFLIWSPIF